VRRYVLQPLLWVWQIVWWLIAVGMMIWLCFYMEMSTMPKNLDKVLLDHEVPKHKSVYPGIVSDTPNSPIKA
jgi:hypothetical protein